MREREEERPRERGRERLETDRGTTTTAHTRHTHTHTHSVIITPSLYQHISKTTQISRKLTLRPNPYDSCLDIVTVDYQ